MTGKRDVAKRPFQRLLVAGLLPWLALSALPVHAQTMAAEPAVAEQQASTTAAQQQGAPSQELQTERLPAEPGQTEPALEERGQKDSSTQKSGRHPDDPWERFNRPMYKINDFLDRYALKPLARGYRWLTPQWLSDRVTRIFQNSAEASNIINNSLQWRWSAAGASSSRLLINSTLGIVGVFDVASGLGIDKHTTDFGLTLGTWGVGEGPYLVVPGLGPSTVRDALADIPESVMLPRNWIQDDGTLYGVTALFVIDWREGLLDAERAIVGDRYGFMRDVYLASRRQALGLTPADDFGADFEPGDWGDQEGDDR